MGRKRDPIWDQVEELPGKQWRCTRCQGVFSGGASRIRAHVNRTPGKGISVCEGQNIEVNSMWIHPCHNFEELTGPSTNSQQDFRQLQESFRGRPFTSFPATPSVNDMPVTPPIDFSALPKGTNMQQDFSRPNVQPQLPVPGDVDSNPATHPTQQREADSLVNTQTLWLHRGAPLPESVYKDVGESSAYPAYPHPSGMMFAPSMSLFKGIPFSPGRLVGTAPQRCIDSIWECLMKDDVCLVGIYGMGGVGKTVTMKHVHDRALSNRSNFVQVFWVTVSKNFSIYKLQTDIARAMNSPDLFNNVDEARRATKLKEHLVGKGKVLLNLDDCWVHFELEEVGIPARSDGLKLILTTRKLDVCQKMLFQEKIKIQPLSAEEAWSLFLEKLGSNEALSSEMEQAARQIVSECSGLPLGIITMAASMRGVDKLYDWWATLEKLKEPRGGQKDMEKEVFPVLKVSYSRLTMQEQQCLLQCALYPEDWNIPRADLIELFIDEGLIHGMNRREKMYNEGNQLLDGLEKACLLEHEYDASMKRRIVRMHDLIRDMALHILTESMGGRTCCLVKAGMQLREMPDDRYWTTELQTISLMKNNIAEIPRVRSPCCPKLSILLLNENRELSMVPESFFLQLCGLKVLNLSHTAIKELPISISDLVKLEALLLCKCYELCHIPSLEKLTSLKRMDLSLCLKLEALPDGMERLVCLTYLNLFHSGIPKISDGLLPNLEKLQFLKIDFREVRGAEIAQLKYLEMLRCNFLSDHEWNTYSQSTGSMPLKFKIIVGEKGDNDDDYDYDIEDDKEEEEKDDGSYKKVTIVDSRKGEETGNCYLIHEDVQKLVIRFYNPVRFCLYGRNETQQFPTCSPLWMLWGEEEGLKLHGPAFPYFPHIKLLEVYKCQKLKYLLSPTASGYLRNLKRIMAWYCDELEGITEAGSELPPGAFANLEDIFMYVCNKMRTVLGPHLLPHLQRLQKIKVEYCKLMGEIIVSPPPETSRQHGTKLSSFTSLIVEGCESIRRLVPSDSLPHLPELKRVYVADCERLEAVIGQPRGGSSSQKSSFHMNKLSCLELSYLPSLLSVYENDDAWFCDSVEKVCIFKCPRLKRMPIYRLDIWGCPSLSPSLKEIIVDCQQWESLQWEQPEAKSLLERFVTFRNLSINHTGP